MSLYSELVQAKIETDSHESDLYFPYTPESRAILARHPVARGVARHFINQAEPHKGELWVDVPFAYEPWWEKRVGKKLCPR